MKFESTEKLPKKKEKTKQKETKNKKYVKNNNKQTPKKETNNYHLNFTFPPTLKGELSATYYYRKVFLLSPHREAWPSFKQKKPKTAVKGVETFKNTLG